MDKDEILKRSREENKDRDFVEAEVLNQANRIALAVSMLLCALLSGLHAIFREKPDCAVWVVQFGILATGMLVKFAKLRRRHELLLGLLYGGFSLCFFVFYLHFGLGIF